MKTVNVFERSCGWPEPGGFYAMSIGKSIACLCLPYYFPKCECCELSLKFSRALQAVPPGYKELIIKDNTNPLDCRGCIHGYSNFYVDWIGSDYTVDSFVSEVKRQGASRRLRPNEVARLKRGDIILAAKKDNDGPDYIFMVLPVTSIRYYVEGNESQEFILKLESQGIEVCKAIRCEVIQTQLL